MFFFPFCDFSCDKDFLDWHICTNDEKAVTKLMFQAQSELYDYFVDSSLHLCTGCSFNIVLFLKFWIFLTLPVPLQRWCFKCHCVHTLTPRGNRERPESGIYLKIFEITQYLIKTLYKQHAISFGRSFLPITSCCCLCW